MRKSALFFYAFVFLFIKSHSQTNALLQGFKTLPDSVKPGCYFYWISDNISQKGVVKDIEAMAKIGIGRAFIGNVGFEESEMSLKYGEVKLFSDEWWKVTEAAISAGTKNRVNIGLFNSPGWSQSGGPWIKHTDAMRYLDGEEIHVEGPIKFSQQLKTKPLFQDVAIMAFPEPAFDNDVIAKHSPQVSTNIDSFNVQKAIDSDTLTEALLPSSINDKSVVNIDISCGSAFTARSLLLYPGKEPMRASIALQAGENGSFETIKTFEYDRSNPALNVGFIPWAPVAISFPAVTAKHYRLVFTNINGNGSLSEIQLTAAAKTERYAEKQLGKMFQTPLPLWNEYQWPEQAVVSDKQAMIDASKIVNLTGMLAADGTLTWNVPEGKWIIIRYGMMPTGITNAPATPEGRGYDIDKMNKAALLNHFNSFVGKIQRRIPAAERKSLKYIVADSYETGSQNWTDDFVKSFKQQYGYDPLPWLPVFSGRVVESASQSDRFLWDVRRLVADKVAYDYVGGLRQISNQNGLKLWLENYGHWGYPSEFLKYGGQSDEIGGEFWAEGSLGSIECRDASSAAHIYGKQSVSAESFTASARTFERYPGMIKKRGDWSFTEGINNTVFHVYIHQPYADKKPGINAWFGTEFNRNNTWFNQGKAFVDYIRRCNFMLQQGKPVNDVAYFIGEDAPKMTGVRDPALPQGYQFDYINAEVIETRLSVKDGRLVLPDGMSYKLLVLPKLATMRPDLLQKIEQLVRDGAIVMGPAPTRSPSLQNFAAADRQVQELARKMWAGVDGKQRTFTQYGKGLVINGVTMEEAMAMLKLTQDFKSNTQDSVLFTHRTTANGEVYFVSNQENRTIEFTPSFRVAKGQPVLWDPVTAETRVLPEFTQNDTATLLPLKLAAGQSCFIVFDKKTSAVAKGNENFPQPAIIQQLSKPWTVYFDTAMRGPAKPVVFNTLEDWTRRSETEIKNYSGTAIYKTTFNIKTLPKNQKIYIYLGAVKVMATVKLNGKSLGTAWTAPFRINATGVIKAGENKLEIEVVNTWVNRLIGDSKLPENERKTWSNVNPYKPDSAYDPSGLTGPVTIQSVAY